MKIHEYQAKALFERYGIPIPRSGVAGTAVQASAVYRRLKNKRCVIKAQVHAGGRGKAGGVRPVGSAAEAKQAAQALLGTRLVTAQTGSDGQPVGKVMVEECLPVAQELYVGIVVDRTVAAPVLLASARGGVNIEQIARETPDELIRETIDPALGLRPYQARRVAYRLGFSGAGADQAASLLVALGRLFVELDANLVEINPLVRLKDGQPSALDAKIVLDDNGVFRHPEIQRLRDVRQEHPIEAQAAKWNLNYVGLDGDIGCMVNGAGLAMATMDIIKLHGGWPANFLDVGGGANVDQVRAAFRLILADKKVKAILVNIFGGIMRCDVIAQGIVGAVQGMKLRVPLVVRLEGTNVEEGRRLLAESGLSMATANGMDDAASKVVAAARKIVTGDKGQGTGDREQKAEGGKQKADARGQNAKVLRESRVSSLVSRSSGRRR